MSSNEEELRRLALELRILDGTVESLQSRVNFVNAVLNELNLANKTLEGIEKEKVNSPLFVPIGGGSYVKAKLESSDKVIYGIGANVAVEKTVKEAKESISNRIAELNKTKRSLEQQVVQVLRRIQEDQDRFRKISSTLNRGAGASNVRKASRETK